MLPSIMYYELSIEAPQPPKGGVMNCELSIVNYQLSIINCQL